GDDRHRVPADAKGRELQPRCGESEDRGCQGGNGQVGHAKALYELHGGQPATAARFSTPQSMRVPYFLHTLEKQQSTWMRFPFTSSSGRTAEVGHPAPAALGALNERSG